MSAPRERVERRCGCVSHLGDYPSDAKRPHELPRDHQKRLGQTYCLACRAKRDADERADYVARLCEAAARNDYDVERAFALVRVPTSRAASSVSRDEIRAIIGAARAQGN